MSNFVEFIEKYNVLKKLYDYYMGQPLDNNDTLLFKNLINYLSELNGQEDRKLDPIAYFYHSYLHPNKRKPLGEFYTPITIVNRILDGIEYNSDHDMDGKALIDISCGSGSFLVQAIKRFIAKELKRLSIDAIENLGVDNALALLRKIHLSISGVDLNPVACVLCQINISFTLFDIIKIIIANTPNYTFQLFQIFNKDALELGHEKKYDFIVGNPPYLFIRDIPIEQKNLIEQGEFITKQGQYDLYQLFIEIGITLLKEGGLLGYIIPDSVLVLSNRKILRRFIYENALIKEISSVGAQFEDPTVANVIIILKKTMNANIVPGNLIQVNNETGNRPNSYFIPQNLIKEWDYNFLIHLNQNDLQIIDHLNKNYPKIKDLIENDQYQILISRGVELTKDGKIIYCNNCNKFFPVPNGGLACRSCGTKLNSKTIEKIIIDDSPKYSTERTAPFLYSMNRFRIKNKKFIVLNKPGIDYKKPEVYENRIIIRQINENNLICATYDDFSYASQSFYNLKIIRSNIKEFNNLYLLGLVNSELLSFYFIKMFGSYKSLFPRILIEKIKTLPVVIPCDDFKKKLAQLIKKEVHNLLKLYQIDDMSAYSSEARLNGLVYDLYQIDSNARQYISAFITNL